MEKNRGPDFIFARKYIKSHVCTQDLPKYIVDDVLATYIPDNFDYGTWEAFDIFGFDYRFYFAIRKDLQKYRVAMKFLDKKFIPVWLHHAYKIDGCMYKKIKESTLIGKEL
jgi:hypothetical protein